MPGEITSTAIVTEQTSDHSADVMQPFIFKLPPELLASVVKFCAQMEPPRPATGGQRLEVHLLGSYEPFYSPVWGPVVQGGSLGWIKLAHVCRLWRVLICEGMPVLWARYIGIFPLAFKVMLRRAGASTLLDVHTVHNHCSEYITRNPWEMLEEPVSWQWWSVEDCAAYRSRVRSVRVIDVRDSHDAPEAYERAPYQTVDLVHLEALEIHYLDFHREDLQQDRFSQSDACIIRSPHLRCIRFTNYFIPWTSNEVTHLSLTFTDQDADPPRDIIIDALTRIAPTIEELELDYCLPHNFLPPDLPAHSFPRLRYLRVRDNNDTASTFLQWARLPPTVSLSVTLIANQDSENWSETATPALADVLRHVAAKPDFNKLKVASLYNGPWSGETICTFFHLSLSRSTTPTLVNGDDEYGAQLTLGVDKMFISDDSSVSGLTALLEHALGPALWQNLTFLDLDILTGLFLDEAQDALDLLPHIRQLRLVDPIVPGDLTRYPLVPSLAHDNPTPSLDLLWIQQSVDTEDCQPERVCQVLAQRLRDALSSDLDEDIHTVSANQRPAITLLRLDLVEACDGVKKPADDTLIKQLFCGLAEEVAWRIIKSSDWSAEDRA